MKWFLDDHTACKMGLATMPQQHASDDDDEDPLMAKTSEKWDIGDLTKPISPAYSPSGSTVTSDTEDLAVEMAAAPKKPTKTSRTGLVPENVAKLLKARKSKVAANKEFTPKKKKDVFKEPKLLAKNNAAERFSSAIAKAKIERAGVGSRALTTALKSKNPELKTALRPKASKTTKKRSEAERALEDVYEYLSKRSSAYEPNKAAIKPGTEHLIPDKIKLAETKLKMAEKRALKVRTRMESAIRETDMAKYDVAVASERLRVAKMYEGPTHRKAENVVMGDGFLSFKEHVLAMKLPEFS